MTNKTAAYLSLLMLLLLGGAEAALAQGALQSQARPGDMMHTTGTTNNFHLPNSMYSNQQRAAFVPTGLGGIAPMYGPRGRNGLPNTTLDSFVLNAPNKDFIYGDEGADGLPPYMGFTTEHRINSGIVGPRAQGISTGHSSVLPNAWGNCYHSPPGESMSGNGRSGGQGQSWTPSTPSLGYNPNLITQPTPGQPVPTGNNYNQNNQSLQNQLGQGWYSAPIQKTLPQQQQQPPSSPNGFNFTLP